MRYLAASLFVLAITIAIIGRYDIRPTGNLNAASRLDRWTGEVRVCWPEQC
jgi:hypothetical protein